MAVTTLRGDLADDHILAAIGQAEFGDPNALDPNVYQLVNFIISGPDAAGERSVSYDVAAK